MRIAVINGPNLNLQGIREPEVYGTQKFDILLAEWRSHFPELTIEYFQSNVEGELINALHQYGFNTDGIVFNPGAFTHTSIALGDAVAAISAPVVEVHISNLSQREDFRQRSYVAPHAAGVIYGFGLQGYALAIEALIQRAAK